MQSQNKMSKKNLQLLQDNILSLPCINDEEHFPTYIDKRIELFLKHIEGFELEIGVQLKENLEKIHILCGAIRAAISLYYEGFPSKAFYEFKKGVDIITDSLAKNKRNFNAGKSKNYYRARLSDETNRLFSPEEMLHIPFDKRGLIKTNRFSIPGSPCLYVSDSIYTCCSELNKSELELETLQFVRLDFHYKYLDLSFTQQSLTILYESAAVEKEIEENSFDSWVVNFLMTWPLSFSCYVQVLNRSAQFKPEYIIPQMLMEWVRMSEDLDGIKYFSTHIFDNQWKNKLSKLGKFNNYAIPIKRIEKTGLCPKLKYDIKVSNSINLQQLIEKNKVIKDAIFNEKDAILERMFYDPSIVFLENIDRPIERYINTAYGKLEYELQKMDANKLN